MAWLDYLLPLFFLFPLAAAATVVVALRSLHDARVRSPFDAHPLREPGQALRDRLDRAFATLFLNAALGPVLVLTPLVYGMGRMLFSRHQNWIEWALYGVLCTLLAIVVSFRLMRDYQRIRRLKLGLACELAVGQELERLIRPEAHPYFVFHDVPADTFVIDHVAITPHAVFVIETRARTPAISPAGETEDTVVVEHERLRFPGWMERRPQRKARQATRWVASWLCRELGQPVPVKGILALPGWKIEREVPDDDLAVVSGEGLAAHLTDACPGIAPMDPTLHDRVIEALNRRTLTRELGHLEGPSI
ncbi:MULTISPECIES: nuclease-related domain-containing protein [unclassified Halomonas]|uniref:NERD domain-containing protein n=2 Tax=unclassified Halomonas TaxID=2609666 RepID=A0AAU7KGM4_9GAMM|nr:MULTISPECIES: nuclease-related domain-containing protein [unclassified Halomonas]MBR9771539.1 NERD domain-containing protein [Gammaproteobacteria bacterium]MBS8269617.1 NERD domain-containing protein [Halomonas litopenaei]KJZ11894.1 NERD domain-containing protein [Halomonas sp. S2151]MAR71549.1 NERD domain-containing protein [Halomonas sp.]MBR9881836.1 NERD domain-containing protein [Gammaproteobacteria bacterium]